jgi:putative YphP/YqiW family bacilliredoxin
MYPETLITPMEAELTDVGFIALKQGDQVTEHFMNHQGTTLLVINSLCGCAGPDARLGVIQALEQVSKKPDHLVTIFAGIDQEAMVRVQDYIKPYPLSAPSIALIQGGQVIHFMERYQIKGVPSEALAAELVDMLEQIG